MRILLIHPNYHSGGAEIAGNWPPAWVAYLAGSLRQAGYTDIRFVDAMTNKLSEDDVRAILATEKPDVVGATAITPSIYKAERLLQIAKEIHPQAVTVLGGIHAPCSEWRRACPAGCTCTCPTPGRSSPAPDRRDSARSALPASR